MRQTLLTVLFLVFVGITNYVIAQCPDPQVPSFITHAEVSLKGMNLNANVQAGVWTRYGGLAIGLLSHAVEYKDESKPANPAFGPTYKQVVIPVATLSGRIVLSDTYLISPYITMGKNYSEKGVKLGLLTEYDMAIGIKGSDQGFGIFLAKIF